MAYSKVQIYNLALARTGHKEQIADITEKSVARELCDTFYDVCRETVLSDVHWRFAKRTAALSLSPSTPPSKWLFCYSLPADCLVARYVEHPAYRLADVENKIPFEVAFDGDKRVLFCDLESAALTYTSNIEDPALFDGPFVSALAMLLGAELAGPLRGKLETADLLRKAYSLLVLQAGAVSLNQGHETRPGSSFERAR